MQNDKWDVMMIWKDRGSDGYNAEKQFEILDYNYLLSDRKC